MYPHGLLYHPPGRDRIWICGLEHTAATVSDLVVSSVIIIIIIIIIINQIQIRISGNSVLTVKGLPKPAGVFLKTQEASMQISEQDNSLSGFARSSEKRRRNIQTQGLPLRRDSLAHSS